MFTGNILEYNSLFNIQIKTCAWFDLSLSKVNNVNHLQLWQKVKKEIIIRRIDLIEAHDDNNDVDIDITIHAIIFQPISKITVMYNVNK